MTLIILYDMIRHETMRYDAQFNVDWKSDNVVSLV